ncbi:hypothetical protein DENSPDRAFT_313264 [Dentipellis sp. KUC8613]|nr:hypothetical protein DENSPDRAFT_313264 [Dentipellis sp. KUC8613]
MNYTSLMSLSCCAIPASLASPAPDYRVFHTINPGLAHIEHKVDQRKVQLDPRSLYDSPVGLLPVKPSPPQFACSQVQRTGSRCTSQGPSGFGIHIRELDLLQTHDRPGPR